MMPAWVTPNMIFLGAFFLGFTVSPAIIWVLKKEVINKGKVWLCGIDPRTKLGFIKRVMPTKGGKISDNPLLVAEKDYVGIDTIENRPMYFADTANAKMFIPDTTGAVQTQGTSASKRYRSNQDIERVSVAGQAVNWAMIAVMAAGLILVGLFILGYMVSKLGPHAS